MTNWIPVKERQPEVTGNYLCTVRLESTIILPKPFIVILQFHESLWYGSNGCVYRGEITAWQPMPEAYQGEGEA